MAGFVAIVAEAPGARVRTAELEQLANSYTSLRAEPHHRRMSAGELGAAVTFGQPRDASLVTEQRNGSWSLTVGSPYLDEGTAIDAQPDALDGQFATVRYRQREKRLEVFCDRFGLQALYRARRNGLAYYSTSVLALARHLRARPDVLGVEVFLRTGPHFGELTNWEGVERLAPARICSYGPSGYMTRVYWSPHIDRRISALGLDAAARECVAVAVDVFHRRFGSRNGHQAWCDLSGGYDTRLAALLLDRAGVRFATNTIGSAHSVDASIARRIAALGGWRWQLGQLPDDWPSRCEHAYASALAWGDGMLEATQLAEVTALQRLRAHEDTLLFNGGGGEHWRDYAWKQEIPFGGKSKRVHFDRWVRVRFMHPMDVSVFKSDPTSRAQESLVDRCRAYAAPYEDELNAVALDVLYAYKAMAHFGAYQSAARGTLRMELPFYAKEAFLTAFSVAPRHRNSHRLARAAIECLNQQIAAVPTTHGDLATPMRLRNAHRFAPFFMTRARGAARKLTQHLPGPTLGALPETTTRPSEAARRRVLDDFVADVELDPAKMRSGSLYEPTALRRLALSNTATTTGWRTLGRIITVERALEAVDACIE